MNGKTEQGIESPGGTL